MGNNEQTVLESERKRERDEENQNEREPSMVYIGAFLDLSMRSCISEYKAKIFTSNTLICREDI